MTNKEKAVIFINYINSNYDRLYKSFKKEKILKFALTEDFFNDSIIKCYEGIEKRGIIIKNLKLSGTCFDNYFFITCKNTTNYQHIVKKRLLKDDSYSEDHHFSNLISYNQQDEYLEEVERIKEDLLIEQIFSYVDSNYKLIHAGFFKFYFKTNFSFREIAAITGYSLATVCHYVNKIKDDVIIKFQIVENKNINK